MISKARWDRLAKHLEKVEERTGGKLKQTPRYSLTDCPIANFAPEEYKHSTFWGVSGDGWLGYWSKTEALDIHIYEVKDSLWWIQLDNQTRQEVTKKVIEWIKEREVKK